MKQFGIPLDIRLSEQVIFDHVVQHFKDQQTACIENGGCRYRSTDEQKACAVGCLLLNEEYYPEMDAGGMIVHKLIEDDTLPDRYVKYESLLSDLQRIHDGCFTKNNHAEKDFAILTKVHADRLKFLGRKLGLSVKSVDW